MDEEMSFPNPVERHDLPVKKRIWPKVVIGVAIIMLLSIAFLPRILQTKVGRRLVRARLESCYNADVSLLGFQTSWFGGTSASQFWIKAADGHVVGFRSFRSDKLSLLKLLRGKFDLGNCAIDGLIVEYALDTGSAGHPDTYDILTGALPRLPNSPPPPLAKLSGHVQLSGAQLALYRNRILPDMSPALTQTHFTNVSGNFDFPSLDQPWHFAVTGMVAPTANEHGSPFDASGDICLGKAGVMSPADISVNAKAAGTRVPTDLIAVLCPLMDVDDCHSAFGDLFNHVDVELDGSGGVLQLNLKDASSSRAHLALCPKFDLRTTPASALIDASNSSGNVIACAMPTGSLGKALPGINPLLSGASDASLTLRISQLDVSFSRKSWMYGSSHAALEVSNVKRPGDGGDDNDFVRQLGALTAAGASNRSLQCSPEPLELQNGVFTVGATPMRWGDATINLAGSCSTDGHLDMTAAVKNPKLAQVLGSGKADFGGLNLTIKGTSDQPQLDMDSTMRKLPPEVAAKLQDWMNTQQDAAHRRDEEAAQRQKDKQVQELIKRFGPEHPATSASGN